MSEVTPRMVAEEPSEAIPYRIQPLGDRVLAQRLPERSQVGNIHIPDAAKVRPVEGVVLAAGPGRDLESGYVLPPRVKAGDRIMFGHYAGTDLPKEYGENLLFLRHDEILAVIDLGPLPSLPADAITCEDEPEAAPV